MGRCFHGQSGYDTQSKLQNIVYVPGKLILTNFPPLFGCNEEALPPPLSAPYVLQKPRMLIIFFWDARSQDSFGVC
ncbi:hypothetical protein QJS10_CPB19g00500 [Acorus calamus]|uniref:Uncharacterized protein n=1 Tax=Acorus calamus TaxID=4465 RepID=A0AAV9CEM4_ACOCL|nr:hypothetical protein QJS10_CPB19g00500 [Acorus calamus]